MMATRLHLLAALLPLIGSVPSVAGVEEPLKIGSQLQLFLDDGLIDSRRDVQFVLHSPQSAEIAIRMDKPWENRLMYDPVVIKDGSRYRMWYRTNFARPPYYTGYAESTDGIHWKKPSLGLIDFRGSKENNIVWVGDPRARDKPFVLSVFKDTNPKTPDAERYKATGISGYGGLQGLVSSDGLQWRLLQTQPVVPAAGKYDSHNISFWDSARQEYVAYARGLENGIRRIRRAATKDFRKFPVPELITVMNPPNTNIEHLYKNAATPYFRQPEMLLMFPKRFVPERKLDPKWPHAGLSDIVFMFSRDGIHWDRRFREAFLRPGLDPLNWHDRAIEVGPGLVPTGSNQMSLYYVEHFRTDSVHIRRGVLRVDGFVSVRAGYRGGEFVTHPLVFDGQRLVMNFSTSAVGSVQVEVQDANGKPLPGFRLADCAEIFGDRIEHPIEWKTGNDLDQLAGKPVRLRFVLRDADLYSIRFQPK